MTVPILMPTARADDADRVVGLDLRADDCLTKPFSIRELLARVRAQRRREGRQGPGTGQFVCRDVCVNLRIWLVTRRRRRVGLSTREFDVLRYLLAQRGEVVSRGQLLRHVWGCSDLTVTRTVDNYISKLRVQPEPKPHPFPTGGRF